tara:strand:- start:1228 stop:2310 length:1083 start_codon:yes stop_codon:yes gene_type:complete
VATGPSQGGLFGPLDDEQLPKPKAPKPEATVAPCAVAKGVAELAAAMPKQLRMGTSSWAFPGWRGLVYADDAPPKLLSRRGLGAYSQHPLLGSVGVDRTFYAPIAKQDFVDYARQVPPSFRFLVKAWGEITSPTVRGKPGKNPRYLNLDSTIDDVLTPAFEGLGDKLGPLLFQFPPQGVRITKNPDAFADALHQFFDKLPNGVHYAVELRDTALMTERYVDAITSAGARHCYAIHPRMPSIARQLELAPFTQATAGPIAVRWMLHSGLTYEAAKEHYQPFDKIVDADPTSRHEIAALATKALNLNVPMTVVVNNKAEGSAPHSVLELAKQIVEKVRTVPGQKNTSSRTSSAKTPNAPPTR